MASGIHRASILSFKVGGDLARVLCLFFIVCLQEKSSLVSVVCVFGILF